MKTKERVCSSAIVILLFLNISLLAQGNGFSDLGLSLEIKVNGFDSSDKYKAIVILLWDATNNKVVDIDGKRQKTSANTLYMTQQDTTKDPIVRVWLESYYKPSSLTNRYVIFLMLFNEYKGSDNNADDWTVDWVKLRTGDNSVSGISNTNYAFGDLGNKYSSGVWAITLEKGSNSLKTITVQPIDSIDDSGFTKGYDIKPKINGSPFEGFYEAVRDYCYYDSEPGDALTRLLIDLSKLDYSGWEPESGSGSGGESGGGGSWTWTPGS